MPEGAREEAAPLVARHAARGERVHILTGAVCNNHCLFCMEDDREGRRVTNGAITDDVVRWILAERRGCEEVCFTSGEPTTNPRLARWASWAREHGVGRVSVMTNGRALALPSYARRLAAAGVGRFYVSLHGHTAKLHDGLTRAPGSFAQTVAGLGQVAALKPYGVELHTSTVLTRRNLPHLGALYRLVRSLGADQAVFNAMQPQGGAHTFFDQLFPTYGEIAGRFGDLLSEQREAEPRVMAFLVDVPLCATEGLPDFHRGYVEGYVHHEPPGEAHEALTREGRDAGRALVQLRRSDLDATARRKRAECARCRYDRVCEGVWENYLQRHGWDSLGPIE